MTMQIYRGFRSLITTISAHQFNYSVTYVYCICILPTHNASTTTIFFLNFIFTLSRPLWYFRKFNARGIVLKCNKIILFFSSVKYVFSLLLRLPWYYRTGKLIFKTVTKLNIKNNCALYTAGFKEIIWPALRVP